MVNHQRFLAAVSFFAVQVSDFFFRPFDHKEFHGACVHEQKTAACAIMLSSLYSPDGRMASPIRSEINPTPATRQLRIASLLRCPRTDFEKAHDALCTLREKDREPNGESGRCENCIGTRH